MRFPRTWRWVAVAVALAVTSCSDFPAGPEIVAPEAVDVEIPSRLSALLLDDFVQSAPLPTDPLLLTKSVTIGPAGGIIRLHNHQLRVPRNAVLNPTIFTMTVVNTGFIGVDLTALELPEGLGLPTVVTTFRRPLLLTLSFARSRDRKQIVPADLGIVHVDGLSLTPVPATIVVNRKWVRARLSHFSKYMMASN